MIALLKHPRIECPKWLKAAKGQPCTLQIPGVCVDTYPHETVVPCHLPSGIKGIGYKSDDFAIDGCHACHKAIDGDWERETKGAYTHEDKLWFLLRALQRTIRNRYERGILKI